MTITLALLSLLWDYENPFASDAGKQEPGEPGHAVYRAVRVPRDHPGLVDRDL